MSMRIPILLSMLVAGLYTFMSCKTTASATSKEKTTASNAKLIPLEVAADPETYRGIVRNVARLHAMLAGKFVQHISRAVVVTANDSIEAPDYRVWMVNDGQDSVIMYSFPVGDPNRDGYWLYHYQLMTSLPNEPVYHMFEQFEELNRDSIRTTYYPAPEDFSVPLETLLKNSANVFSKVTLADLKPSELPGALYTRTNPLLFKDQTSVKDEDQTISYLYQVQPAYIIYQTLIETAKDKEVRRSKFIKLAGLQ